MPDTVEYIVTRERELETAKSCMEMTNWMYENMAFLLRDYKQTE